MPNVALNATTDAVAMVSPDKVGWFVTALIFAAVITMLYILSQNFRQFIYGSIATTALSLVFFFSRYLGTSYSAGDKFPVQVFGWVCAFILVSIGLGKLLQNTQMVKNFEDSVLKDPEEKEAEK